MVQFSAENTSGGTNATAKAVVVNDVDVTGQVTAHGSGFTGTVFGITAANYVGFLTSNDADTAGMLIGPQRTSGGTRPIVFGSGTFEIARFSLGLAATGVFSVNYTLEATDSVTAGVTLASGLAVAKKIFGGSTIDAVTSYSVNGTKVIGAQGAAVADATDAASVIARLNDLLARLRTHGLIAT
jgi:hypothetical protein